MRSSSIRILAVDDEPDLCIMTKEFLTGTGELAVDAVFSVAEARAALSKRRYDAIISDYQMPGEDGIQFLKSLRASGDHTPFILFTGKGREEVVIEALNNGADSYLQKGGSPVPLYTELSHRIHALVQRKGVECALEESEEQHRIIFDQSPIAIELYDPSGSLLSVNPSCLRLFGVEDIDAVRGFSLFDDPSISDDNLLQIHRGATIRYEAPFDFGRTRNLNLYNSTRKGVIWLDVLITPLKLDREPITGFLVHIQDITDRKVAEDQRDHAREQLKLAIEGSGVGLWDWNIQTGETVYNERWAGIIGYELEELSPLSIETWMNLVHPDDQRKSNELLARHFTGETSIYECETRLRHKDGRWIWVLDRGKVSAWDDQHRPLRMSGTHLDITERKNAEEALKENERKLSVITNSIRDTVWLLDLELKPVWMSPSVFVTSGFCYEEYAKMSLQEQLAPGSLQKVLIAVRTYLTPENLADPTKEISFSSELEFYRRNGETIWIDTVYTVLRDDAGRPTGILGVGRDITERKKAEKELRSSQHFLSRIMETSPNLVYIYDLVERRIEYANQTVADFLGYSLEQTSAMGQDLFVKVLEPEDVPKVAEYQESLRHIADGEARTTEFRVRRADGNQRWLRSRDVVFTRDPDGSARSELGFAEDVTESKRAEDALRISEDRFRIISQSSPDLIFIQDRDLRYIWILNTPLGLKEMDMLGKTDWELFPKEGSDLMTDVKRTVMESGKDTRFSIALPSVTGASEHFDGVYRPRYDAEGNNDGIIGYFRNVTETVRGQEALKEVNRKLNLLTSITRHDIKNQLLALTGHLSLMEGKGDASFEQHLKKAEKAAKHISSMIEFTKTYEDLGVLAPTWQDVKGLVDKCSMEVPHANVSVNNDIPSDIEMFADPLIAKVFCNLIDNSMRHGTGTSNIRFSVEERDGVRAIVYEDDGIGIQAEMKDKIFARGSGKDHGLGLFLSREILAITGITIGEEGKHGQGARFVMRLPLGKLRGDLSKSP